MRSSLASAGVVSRLGASMLPNDMTSGLWLVPDQIRAMAEGVCVCGISGRKHGPGSSPMSLLNGPQ